jgi:hypothetical protein
VTVGEATLVSGIGTMLLSGWPIVEGNWKTGLGVLIAGTLGAGLGYGIIRLERPPRPPTDRNHNP